MIHLFPPYHKVRNITHIMQVFTISPGFFREPPASWGFSTACISQLEAMYPLYTAFSSRRHTINGGIGKADDDSSRRTCFQNSWCVSCVVDRQDVCGYRGYYCSDVSRYQVPLAHSLGCSVESKGGNMRSWIIDKRTRENAYVFIYHLAVCILMSVNASIFAIEQ